MRASAGFSWSRFGPIVPVEPASFSVWQLVQPALRKTALPAVGSPVRRRRAPASSGAAVVVCGALAPVASGFSLPKISTAEIIATKNSAADRDVEAEETAREVRVPARQDERRDEREDDERSPDDGQPDLVAGRQVGDDERKHRGGNLPDERYESAASPAPGSSTPVSGGPTGRDARGGGTAARTATRRSRHRRTGRRTRPSRAPSGCRRAAGRTRAPGSSRRRSGRTPSGRRTRS